jgi:hypothetical protein
MRLLFSREGSWDVSSFNSCDCNNSTGVREGLLKRQAPASAEDPEEAQDRDRAAEEALGWDLERDRGRAEGRRQDLVNSFQLEVPQRRDGCLSVAFRGSGEVESSGPKGLIILLGLCTG